MGPHKLKKLFLLAAVIYCVSIFSLPFLNQLRFAYHDFNYPPLVKGVRYPALLLFLIFFLAYWSYLKLRLAVGPRINPYFYGGAVVCLGVYVCSIYPVFSIDLYEFIFRGRIMSVYHANPYLKAPAEFPQDLFYPIIFWKYQAMAYGPVWSWLIWLPTYLAGESIFLNQFFMKLMLFSFYLLSAWQIYRLSLESGLKNPFFYFEGFLLNPFFIVTFLVDGHNDIVMVCFLLWSLAELKKGRDIFSLSLFVLSILTKYITVLFVPLYAWYFFKKYKALRARLFFMAKAFVTAGALGFCIFKPFWIGNQTFKAINEARGSFHDNTITYVLYQGLHFFSQALTPERAMELLKIVFFLIYGAVLLLTMKKGVTLQNLLRAISVIFISYFVAGSFQFGSWYLAWLLPFLMLSDIPLAFFLQALLGFAALISFWKRISYLLLAAGLIYFILLVWYYRRRDKKGILNVFMSVQQES